MRCNLLVLCDTPLKKHELLEKLKDEQVNPSVHEASYHSQWEALLEHERFDMVLIIASLADALAVAQTYTRCSLFCKVPLVFNLTRAHKPTLIALKELGIDTLLVGKQSVQNLATFVSLKLFAHYYKQELFAHHSLSTEYSIVVESDAMQHFVIRHVNEAFLSFESKTKTQLIGKQSPQLVFDLEALREDIVETLHTQRTRHLPNFFFLREGEREWFDVHMYAISSNSVGIIASPQTSIKRAYDKIEYTKRYLQTLLNAQKQIVFITDKEQLLNVNGAFLTFFGVDSMHAFVRTRGSVWHYMPIDGVDEEVWIDTVLAHPKLIYKLHITQGNRRAVFVPHVQTVYVDGKAQYVVMLWDITELEHEKEKLRQIAMTDPLTGVSNRLKFNSVIEGLLALSKRYNSPLSFVLLDVDAFKQVNDVHGHTVGDEVLQALSTLIQEHIRQADLLIRWGGEEFLLVLPNTPKSAAVHVAQKIGTRVAAHTFVSHLHITLSIGVTQFDGDEALNIAIARADEALYLAKNSGKNSTKAL